MKQKNSFINSIWLDTFWQGLEISTCNLFFALIVVSIYVLIYIWNPVENTLHTSRIQNHTKSSPGKTETVTTIENDTVVKLQHITTINSSNNREEEIKGKIQAATVADIIIIKATA